MTSQEATGAKPLGVSASLHEPLRHSRRPALPENDPFYAPPTGFAASAPGTILRTRDISLAWIGLVPQKVSAWQLLVRSSDLNGKPDASVTTVLLARSADPTQSRPLLSYQCAIDAVASHCTPSHSLQRGAKIAGAAPQWELMLLLGAVARGWAVAIPDHGGTRNNWGAPREPGYRVLDGVRAALDFHPLGLTSDTKVALWGYSGGGLASSWAAEMAVDYAPELDIVGAALGSPVGDPGSAFLRLNGTALSGLPALVISGLRHVYPELDRAILRHTNVEGLALLKSIENMSTFAAVRKLNGHDMSDVIDIPLADFLALPELAEMFHDIQVGLTIPTMPLFVVQAVRDQIIAVDDVDGQVHRYRAGGAQVTYLRDRCSEHFTLHPIATPVTLHWLTDRFAGKPLPAASTRTVRSTAFSSAALFGALKMAWVAVKVAFGRTI